METHRGGLCGVTTLSGVSNEDKLRVPPSRARARMAVKDYSDNVAVRSRGWDLVSPIFQTANVRVL